MFVSRVFGVCCLLFVSLFEKVLSQYTYCYDSYECDSTTISTTYAYCYGYYGCDSATITSNYLYTSGIYSSIYADITSYYVYSYGYRANYGADINAYLVYGYGYQQAYYADISPYSSTLYVYLYGYFSGIYSDINCYSGDTCKIYCGSSYGCYYLSFYCYSGATCYYDCNDDSSYCPTMYSGVESKVLQMIETSSSNELDNEVKIKKPSHQLKMHYSGLTDDEIKQFKTENEEKKKDKELLLLNSNEAQANDLKMYEMAKERELKNGKTMEEIDAMFPVVYRPKAHENESFVKQLKRSQFSPWIYGLSGALIVYLFIYINKQCQKRFMSKNNSGNNNENSNEDNEEYIPILA